MRVLPIEHVVPARIGRRMLMLSAVLGLSIGCTTSVIALWQFDEQELMSRWNTVASGVTVQGWSFRWDTFDQFPHPTFKGGSQEAYRLFAEILVAVFERDDNFDYLAQNRLFRAPLQSGGHTFTFEYFTALLLAMSDWAGISTDTLQKLKDFDARIRASP